MEQSGIAEIDQAVTTGNLAFLDETDGGRAEAAANAKDIAAAERKLATNPRIVADGSVREDLRWQLGYLAGLRRRDERIENARKALSKGT